MVPFDAGVRDISCPEMLSGEPVVQYWQLPVWIGDTVDEGNLVLARVLESGGPDI